MSNDPVSSSGQLELLSTFLQLRPAAISSVQISRLFWSMRAQNQYSTDRPQRALTTCTRHLAGFEAHLRLNPVTVDR